MKFGTKNAHPVKKKRTDEEPCSVLCTIYSLHSQQAEFRTVPFYHRTVVVVAVITTTSHQVKNVPLRSERGYDDDDYSRS